MKWRNTGSQSNISFKDLTTGQSRRRKKSRTCRQISYKCAVKSFGFLVHVRFVPQVIKICMVGNIPTSASLCCLNIIESVRRLGTTGT